MILVTALFGAGAGAGFWIVLRSLRPHVTPLGPALDALARSTPASGGPSDPGADAVDPRLGSLARRVVEVFGGNLDRHAVAFHLTGRSAARHALDKLVGGTGGALTPLVVSAALAVVGIRLPLPAVVGFAAACAVGGWLLPDFALRDAATRRQKAFRHALSSYLDLVNVIIAGGGGIQTALYTAAEAGDGWAFASIRRALDRARLTNRSPWDTFTDLARELEVPELAELAASVALAGSQGARIRSSLAAKADTLRGHQVAETEAAAEAATERMTIPVAVLLFGFLLFVAYPAVQQITTVSGPAGP